jgi:hypothetical protein
MSGASSEGPDSPDHKYAVAPGVDIVQVRVHVQDQDEARVVRLDAGAGLRLDKKSGEVTPTGGGRMHAGPMTMVV